jgi:hypothetical protein
MVSPANLFRMMIELIFVLLGGFLAWLGLSNKVMFDPRSPAWLGLAAVLVYWGVRSWMKTTRAAKTADRTATRVGGVSLIVVGFVMIALVFVQYRLVGITMALAGFTLAVRGLAGAVLSFRSD